MSNPRKLEVAGSALGTAALAQRIMMKTGGAVHTAEESMCRMAEEGLVVENIRFKCGGDPRGDWLAVVTARTESSGIVAFHGGEGFASCVEGVMQRIKNGSLKWKADEYAK